MSNIKQLEPLKIPNESRKEVLSYLQNKLSGDGEGYVIFRRVSEVDLSNVRKIFYYNSPDSVKTLNNLEGITQREYEKHIEIKCSSFNGYTHTYPIRREPKKLHNRKIMFHSRNYNQNDFTFKNLFSNDLKAKNPVAPITGDENSNNGDLLFLYFSKDKINKLSNDKQHVTSADKWFICSEQFLRAWTAIMYDWHDSFNKFVPKTANEGEEEYYLRKRLFTGNRLMTNSWLKYKLSLNAHGQKMSKEESQSRFWIKRTEYASRRWVDTYACLVLIARYGELPCPSNIPDIIPVNQKDDKPPRVSWDLPHSYVSTIVLRSINKYKIHPGNIKNYDIWSRYCYTENLISHMNEGRLVQGFLDKIALSRSDRLEREKNENSDNELPEISKEPVNDNTVSWADIVNNKSNSSSDNKNKKEKINKTIYEWDFPKNISSSTKSIKIHISLSVEDLNDGEKYKNFIENIGSWADEAEEEDNTH